MYAVQKYNRKIYVHYTQETDEEELQEMEEELQGIEEEPQGNEEEPQGMGQVDVPISDALREYLQQRSLWAEQIGSALTRIGCFNLNLFMGLRDEDCDAICGFNSYLLHRLKMAVRGEASVVRRGRRMSVDEEMTSN